MDEGPFRTSRPADRRAVSRPEPAYRQPEEPQQPRQEPPVERAALPQHALKQKKTSKRFRLPLILIILLVVIAIIGGIVWSVANGKNNGTAIDTSRYQAIFFTNGQVYFGKLSTLNDRYLKLTDVYYLQTKTSTGSETNPQETSSDKTDVQLIKLGEEIHGPEDEMVLSRDQVLFYENLKTDGKVAQSIEAYKKSR